LRPGAPLGHPGGLPGRADRLFQDPGQAAAEVFGLVAGRLAQVDTLFRESLESPLRIVHEMGGFVAESGGKRVRPTLHLLCARLCDYDGPHDVLLGAVLEMIHSATLIHDDVVDEAKTRRGRPSVNSTWGNNLSVLFGDYLLARAMDLALRARSLEVMERLAEITVRMAEGEMLQTRYVGRLDLTIEEHLDLIERKTAALFAGCCELAGMVAGVDPERREALRRYGLQIGMAFQVVDDLLDFTGNSKTLGKPAASDLREGKVTLALIDLMGEGSTRALVLSKRILESGAPDAPEIAELTELLGESGALERTHDRARQYAAQAARELVGFPDGRARRALQTVPEVLVHRDR
jgi:octaprenyl-diphosphate synthase